MDDKIARKIVEQLRFEFKKFPLEAILNQAVDPKVIDEGHRLLLRGGDIKSSKKLKKLTGLSPTNETVQDVYKYCFWKESEFTSGSASRIAYKFQGVVGIMFNYKSYAQKIKDYTEVDPEDKNIKQWVYS